jgi:hypothetical protein
MSTRVRRFVGASLAAALVGLAFALLHIGIYGLTLFALMPVLLGGLSAWTFRAANGSEAAGIGAVTVFAGLFALLLLGSEGLICIGMALPLALPLGALGGWLVYRGGLSPNTSAPGFLMMLLLPTGGITWDTQAPTGLFEVRSAVEIAASPEQVWKHVVTFSDLPEPREWYFRAGLAYPKRARIEGSGPGAIRYCDFSTGPFVEPIVTWDEPRLLRFRVTENPAPMEEWSFYSHVAPRHLHGYLVSKQGQFQLTRLPGNRTLLEGTTWYRHALRPSEYWRWWSDAIIHRIHLRVLNHIRELAEKEAAATSYSGS